MLQTYAKAKRKELKQIITIYQSILEFSLDELGMDTTIKYNKVDPDNLIDDVNAKLIEVCDEYLKENNIGLDKYQLSMLVMDLYTKTIAELPQPFYVQIRESKNLLKEYVKANKEYIKKVDKVKGELKENEKLASELEKKNREVKTSIEKTVDIQEAPSNITKEVAKKNIPTTKKSTYNHNTDTLATTFTF